MSQARRKRAERRTRSYNAPRRAEQAGRTRARIRAAARERFLAQGFAKTTMREVARRAGVSEATVYLAFPSKAALLSEVIRFAVRGPSPDERFEESARWRAVIDAPTGELLGRFAGLMADIMHDLAPVLAVGEAAATEDATLLELRRRGRAAEHATLRTLAGVLDDRGELARHLSADRAADILYAVATDAVYLRLTRDRGWSREEYVAWLTHTLERTLLGR